MTFEILLEICRLFWSLAKPAQDSILWAMQTNGGSLGDSSSGKSDGSSDESSDDDQRNRWNVEFASGPLPVTVEKSIFYILTLPK